MATTLMQSFMAGQPVVAGQSYTYNGQSWLALKNQSAGNNPPKANTYWQLKTDVPPAQYYTAEQINQLIANQLTQFIDTMPQTKIDVVTPAVLEAEVAEQVAAKHGETNTTVKELEDQLKDALITIGQLKKQVFPETVQQEVTGFQLWNYTNEAAPVFIQNITEGQVIQQSSLPASIRIRVITNPATVGSVKIVVSGALVQDKQENGAPYETLTVPNTAGEYKVSAFPYTLTKLGGDMGIGKELNFSIKGVAVSQASTLPKLLYLRDSVNSSAPRNYATTNLNADYSVRIWSVPDTYDTFDSSWAKAFLDSNFPNADDTTIVLINWETKPLKDLSSSTTSVWQAGRTQIQNLASFITTYRPNMRFIVYSLVDQMNYTNQLSYNTPMAKFDGIFNKLWAVATQYYAVWAPEQGVQLFGSATGATLQQTGLNGLIAAYKNQMKLLIEIGNNYNKPTVFMPWDWISNVKDSNGNYYAGQYRKMLLQPDVFAQLIKVAASYKHPTLNKGIDYILPWDPQKSTSRLYNASAGTGMMGGLPILGTSTPWVKKEDLTTTEQWDAMRQNKTYAAKVTQLSQL